MTRWTVGAPEELESVAHEIIRLADSRILLLEGPMGAGKTTLAGFLLRELGSGDPVQSPTFSLVNEYLGASGPIYHFDFYRLNSLQEALDIGAEDYFYSGAFCLVEWPALVMSLMPENANRILIEPGETNTRQITFISANLGQISA